MTLQFTGTFSYRFRISIFGHELFAGPWQSQSISISEPIPSESTTISICDGFTSTLQSTSSGVSIAVKWEGLTLLNDSIPLTGTIPVNLQPLKGIILTGTASVVA